MVFSLSLEAEYDASHLPNNNINIIETSYQPIGVITFVMQGRVLLNMNSCFHLFDLYLH